MGERKRILLITAAPLAVGGLEKHLLTLGEGLQQAFTLELLGDLREPFFRQWEQLGLKAYQYRPTGKFDLSAVREIRRVIRTVQPDLIHIHDPRAGLLARLAKIGFGIMVVYSIHYPAYQYIDASELRRKINAQVERVLNQLLTDYVVFPYWNTYREAVRRRLVSINQARLVPSGIDSTPFVLASQALGSRERTCQGNSRDVCRLIVVARLSPEKNVGLALETLAKLVEDGYPASMWVVGDGPIRTELELFAQQLGVGDAVQFLGEREDVPQLLAQADIFLLTSQFEAGPYVLMEAMAAGKPCVATNVGDVSRMLGNGIGVIVDNPTPKLVADALADLMENEELRKELGGRAQAKAVAELSQESMLTAYAALYDEILGGRDD